MVELAADLPLQMGRSPPYSFRLSAGAPEGDDPFLRCGIIANRPLAPPIARTSC
ncbi:hypothetical protein X757_31705 [Mesorhizobium sp. LSHC414A00]|nr:hypothetical protein X757_31705 [Mesorhizobium sp. LSHC414A00]